MMFSVQTATVLTVLFNIWGQATAKYTGIDKLDTFALYACPVRPAITSILYQDMDTKSRFGIYGVFGDQVGFNFSAVDPEPYFLGGGFTMSKPGKIYGFVREDAAHYSWTDEQEKLFLSCKPGAPTPPKGVQYTFFPAGDGKKPPTSDKWYTVHDCQGHDESDWIPFDGMIKVI